MHLLEDAAFFSYTRAHLSSYRSDEFDYSIFQRFAWDTKVF